MLDSNGLLTFSGSGPMYDYEWDYRTDEGLQPWFPFRERIREIRIGEGITRIGDCAFRSCGSAGFIGIPSSVREIGWTALLDTAALSEIYVHPANAAFVSVDGVLFDRDMRTLLFYPNKKEGDVYTVPSSVTGIESLCSANLREIRFPDSVTDISAGAFEGCGSLTDVILPARLENIGMYAFLRCGSLRTVWIPRTIRSVPGDLFYLCPELQSVAFEGSEDEWETLTAGSEAVQLPGASLLFGVSRDSLLP